MLGVCHLSGWSVTTPLKRSTLRHGPSKPRDVGIHDLATHQAYGSRCHHRLGALLSHLFTLTRSRGCGRSFSVTLLRPHGRLPVRKHGALCCPDVPHLPLGEKRQTAPLRCYLTMMMCRACLALHLYPLCRRGGGIARLHLLDDVARQRAEVDAHQALLVGGYRPPFVPRAAYALDEGQLP